MLEIILLIWLTRKLARIAEEKGHSRSWAALGPIFWIAGEVIGLIIGFAAGMDMGALVLAIGLAAAGAWLAYAIISSLSPREHAYAAYGYQGYGHHEQPIGTFDMNNPYSPPGTYPRGA